MTTTDETAYRNWLAKGRRRGWTDKADALAVNLSALLLRDHPDEAAAARCPDPSCQVVTNALAAWRATP